MLFYCREEIGTTRRISASHSTHYIHGIWSIIWRFHLEVIYPNVMFMVWIFDYRQTSDLSRTLVGNKIVDHLDEVEASTAENEDGDGAAPAGDAPTTYSFST